MIEKDFLFSEPPPPPWFQIPPSFPANYQYCDTLHTWWQMNHRACAKNASVTVIACKILQVLTVTVDFFQKKVDCNCQIWQMLTVTFWEKVDCKCKILQVLTVTIDFFFKNSVSATVHPPPCEKCITILIIGRNLEGYLKSRGGVSKNQKKWFQSPWGREEMKMGATENVTLGLIRQHMCINTGDAILKWKNSIDNLY